MVGQCLDLGDVRLVRPPAIEQNARSHVEQRQQPARKSDDDPRRVGVNADRTDRAMVSGRARSPFNNARADAKVNHLERSLRSAADLRVSLWDVPQRNGGVPAELILSDTVARLRAPEVNRSVARRDVPCSWCVQNLEDRLAMPKVRSPQRVLRRTSVWHGPNFDRLVPTARSHKSLRVKDLRRSDCPRVPLHRVDHDLLE
mmetsp:Transcript_36880/g.96605  ORF Transcript_36880/g.96605 Transcript_36880/m.96605 type:complete len:201 (+) Transcript_36880:401-1003(+)